MKTALPLNDKTFEEVWSKTGFKYGKDALENVKLGWNLCADERNKVELERQDRLLTAANAQLEEVKKQLSQRTCALREAERDLFNAQSDLKEANAALIALKLDISGMKGAIEYLATKFEGLLKDE